jgi:hypothetical protein
MKTERITVLGSTEFKAFLTREANEEGISVSELVRQRCERRPSLDEQLLSMLAEELRSATKSANAALDAGLIAVEQTRATIKKLRAETSAPGGVQ